MSVTDAIVLKEKLFSLCSIFIDDRISSAKLAIDLAQSSANEETKSSAGDKYETGRAMAQLEIENGIGQLAAAVKMKKSLDLISPHQPSVIVQPGSVVFTNQGNFYISIPAGKLVIGVSEFLAISPSSPLGQVLMDKREGTSLTFKHKEYLISKIV